MFIFHAPHSSFSLKIISMFIAFAISLLTTLPHSVRYNNFQHRIWSSFLASDLFKKLFFHSLTFIKQKWISSSSACRVLFYHIILTNNGCSNPRLYLTMFPISKPDLPLPTGPQVFPYTANAVVLWTEFAVLFLIRVDSVVSRHNSHLDTGYKHQIAMGSRIQSARLVCARYPFQRPAAPNSLKACHCVISSFDPHISI